jgi:hypothetical protein
MPATGTGVPQSVPAVCQSLRTVRWWTGGHGARARDLRAADALTLRNLDHEETIDSDNM